MRDYISAGLFMSAVGLTLSFVAFAVFAAAMPVTAAANAATGIFIASLICAWIIAPLMDKFGASR